MATEYRLDQTGPEVQERIDQVFPNRDNIAAENERAEGAEENLDTQKADRTELQAETQRATEVEQNLQQQINDIVSGDATVNITASPATIFLGEESTITLNATVSKAMATSIDITGGNLSEAIHGSGSAQGGTDTLTPEAAGTAATYLATFVISGNTRTAQRSVTAVYPIYYGAGMEEGDVLGAAVCKATARTAPTGTYNVTISGGAKYIYFFVPANMTTQINSAKMGGFDFPLQTLPDTTDEGGVAYKVYRTPNTNEVGTYSIVING